MKPRTAIGSQVNGRRFPAPRRSLLLLMVGTQSNLRRQETGRVEKFVAESRTFSGTRINPRISRNDVSTVCLRRSPPTPQRNATGACQSAQSVIGGLDREHRRQAAPEVAMRTRNGRADTTGLSKGGPVGRPSDSSDPPEQNAPINVRAGRLARAASCAIRRSRPVQASRMANSPWSLPHATPQSGTNAPRYRRTHR